MQALVGHNEDFAFGEPLAQNLAETLCSPHSTNIEPTVSNENGLIPSVIFPPLSKFPRAEVSHSSSARRRWVCERAGFRTRKSWSDSFPMQPMHRSV